MRPGLFLKAKSTRFNKIILQFSIFFHFLFLRKSPVFFSLEQFHNFLYNILNTYIYFLISKFDIYLKTSGYNLQVWVYDEHAPL